MKESNRFSTLQAKAMLSNSATAKFLDVNVSTIKRWRNNSYPAPSMACMSLELYIIRNAIE